MQPNKAWTPWGFVASLVNVVAVLAALLVIFALSTLTPSNTGLGDDLENHMCVTIATDALREPYESAFGRPGTDGVRTAVTEEDYCKPFESFDHPFGARVVEEMEGIPTAIAVLVLALGLRRIINRTRDDGPFQPEAVRLLRAFRWWVGGVLGVALVIEWILRGIREQLLTDEMWPNLDFVTPVVVAFVIAHVVAELCAFGVRQREDAVEHGLGQPPAGDSS